MLQEFGIRFKIVAGTLLLCLLPLFFLWYIVLETGKNSIIHSTGESMVVQASIVRYRAEDLTKDARELLLWLASQPEVLAVSSGIADNNITQRARSAASSLLRSFADSTGIINEVSLLNPETGEVVVSTTLVT